MLFMLLEHDRYYGLGMDALAIVCSWNTNGIMVWAWMLWSSYALGTRSLLWLGHGCSGPICSWIANGIMVWAWMLWSPYALGTRTELWFGHACSGHRMLLEHERSDGLGMDALVIVWSAGGSTWWQRVSPAHRPWSLTSFKEILLEPPNAGSTRLRLTKHMVPPNRPTPFDCCNMYM